MWAHHRRVIWLCLTKQHLQTQKFLLRLFSHHRSEAVAGGGMDRDRIWQRDQGQRERGNISLAWSEIQLPDRHTSLREREKSNLCKEKRKQRSPGVKSSWSPQKCPLRGVQGSPGNPKYHDLIGCQPETETPDWLWHIPHSNTLQLAFTLLLPYQIICGC